MKVPLSWLKEYFDEPLDPDEIGERLTLAGIEVELVQPLGAFDPRVRVGRITALEPVGRSTLLTVEADRTRRVITNAPELAVGQSVAVALPGATLFAGTELELREVEAAELYGHLSEGVLASAADLGVGTDATRAVTFGPEVPVGASVREHVTLGEGARADYVLHLAILPNIARCQSMRGVAREVAALLRKTLKPIDEPSPLPAAAGLSPTITATDACTSLSVLFIENVRVTESPEWIRRRLTLAGMSPINNVVDASNYVMLELGQPTHPYDADRLPSHDLGVRRSRAGERLHTLHDPVEEPARELPEGVPVIVSDDIPVAVAGVVGGRATAIHDETRRVLLESASFDAISIRRSQQAMKIITEASGRFSRGVNPELPVLAARRFLELLRLTAPDARVVSFGEITQGVPPPRRIELREQELDDSLGVHLGLDVAADALRRVGFEVDVDVEGKRLVATASNARNDIALSADLIEEVARVVGYDRIPETLPEDPIPERVPDRAMERRERLRDRLVAAGLQEVITYTLSSVEVESRLYLGHDVEPPRAVPIVNPISVERSVLRTTLLSGMLEAVALNLRHTEGCRFFQLGPAFWPNTSGGPLPVERERVAFVLAGLAEPPSLFQREPRRVDFFDLKAVAEALLAALRIEGVVFEPTDEPPYRPGAAARLVRAGKSYGTIGAVHPVVAKAFDLEQRAVFAGELALDDLLADAGGRPRYVEYDRFPSIDIDIAMVLPLAVSAGAVRDTVRVAAGPLLREVEVFDEFRGAQFGDDRKGLAVRLRLNGGERTLEMSEALEARARATEALRKELGAQIRE